MMPDTPDIEPLIDNDDVPLCTTVCKQHDGKRCGILGHKPWDFCEPAICRMIRQKMRLRDELERLQACVCDEDHASITVALAYSGADDTTEETTKEPQDA